jgi:hypothetical protein
LVQSHRRLTFDESGDDCAKPPNTGESDQSQAAYFADEQPDGPKRPSVQSKSGAVAVGTVGEGTADRGGLGHGDSSTDGLLGAGSSRRR